MASQLPSLFSPNIPPRHRRDWIHIDWSKAITLQNQAGTPAKDNASLDPRMSATSLPTTSSHGPHASRLELLASLALEANDITNQATHSAVLPQYPLIPPAVEARPSVFAPFAAAPHPASTFTDPTLGPSTQHGPGQDVAEKSTPPASPDYREKLADIEAMLLRVASEITSLQEELKSGIQNENAAPTAISSPLPSPAPLPTDAAAAAKDESLADMTNLGENPSVQKKTGGKQKGKVPQRKRGAGRGKGVREAAQ
ncbi:hypothetical protein GY45DRAFT_1324128 [Cubamyces sp. BRFM 1775]|nr:hypothetical protein GY45DRAFT_1324128 [Cubamyces sp. BRFM 1775]